MADCLTVLYSLLNQLLSFVTPWGFTFGVVLLSPIIIFILYKGLKHIL